MELLDWYVVMMMIIIIIISRSTKDATNMSLRFAQSKFLFPSKNLIGLNDNVHF